MADDPTTTGLKWPLEGEPPEDWQETVASATKQAVAAGVSPSQAEVATGKGFHFELPNFVGDFQIAVSERLLLFSIVIPPLGGMEKASDKNPPTQHAFILPRSLVGDVDLEKLFGLVSHNFRRHIWQRFGLEAALLFTSLVNFTLLNLNPGLSSSGSRDRIIKNHIAHSEALLRQFFGNTKPPRRGRSSPWTVLELSTAVQRAAGEVAAEQPRGRLTASKVAQRMRKLYGEKAPKTGKALLKLVGRHKLRWADLLEPSPSASPSPEPPGDNELE